MTTSAPAPAAQQPSPMAALRGLILGYWFTQAVYVASKLGIADLLKDEPQHPDALAQAAGAHPGALTRLLRLLASQEVFAEDAHGRFALTPAAALLQTGALDSLHLLALSPQLWWRSVGDLLYSVQTGNPAYDRLYGMAFHEAMERDAEAAEIYDALLAAATAQDAATLAAAYDFAGAHMVIDVGGGYGRFIAAILKGNPHLHGVLFERPPVVPGARRVIEAEGLATRCECVGGDFFAAVPNGCDIYLLKWVLLGWDDEHARVLLENCHRAMSAQAKLLIVEPLIPPGNAASGETLGREHVGELRRPRPHRGGIWRALGRHRLPHHAHHPDRLPATVLCDRGGTLLESIGVRLGH
jgi:hypothetical protein